MKVGIYTLGCKVNTYESEFVRHILEQNGYLMADFEDICDVYIINTCTVTNTSDVKSRKMIHQARKRNPNACIVAMGCYVQAKKEEVLDDVDIVLGTKDKSKIVELLADFFKNKKQIVHVLTPESNFEDMYLDSFETRTRAFVKIQDGCENYCNYCIIPYVRGKCCSKKFETVIKEVTTLVQNGFQEIVLTGIHTGNYGADIGKTFSSLLKEIVQIKGLKRLRISSIEVTELDDDFFTLLKDYPVIVDHLHIPIQAASDKVLTMMNRKYDLDFFCKQISKIRAIRPQISITTDIIAGHPGEDEKTFEESLKVLEELHFAKLHVFPYSKRQNTKSAEMEQISEEKKKEHAKKLLALSRKQEIEYMNQFLNQQVEVLIERNKDGVSIGHTGNYLQVKIDGTFPSGTFVTGYITTVEYPYCIATAKKRKVTHHEVL